jgi:hypothetical protein
VHFSDERAIVILLEGGAEARSIDRADLAALERRQSPRPPLEPAFASHLTA